jgi:hypothetical protein
MSHFAKVENGVVTEVIVSEKDFINSGVVGDEFLWVQYSYNSNFRGNPASVGCSYDNVNSTFIKPKPYSSWVLNEALQWEAPKEITVSEGITFKWDESIGDWVDDAPNREETPLRE